MDTTVKNIADKMEALAPLSLRYFKDNCGLLVGSFEKKVKTVLISLDLLDEVVDEAISIKADLIINHHPAIFSEIRQINNCTPLGRRLLKLIENGIAVYAAHTNLDITDGGTNDVLFNLLKLSNRKVIPNSPENDYGFLRIGEMQDEMELPQFAEYVKKAVNAPFVTFAGNESSVVSTVAVCTGSGAKSDLIHAAKKAGAHVLVTGDVTHHAAHEAIDLGLSIVDASHYYTEVIVCDALQSYLQKEFDIEFVVSKVNGQMLKLYSLTT